MAIAGVLLLTATATYIVLKWRLIIPYLTSFASDTAQGLFDNVGFGFRRDSKSIFKLLARPTVSALISASTVLWGISLDKSFESKPSGLVISMHLALIAAVISFALPSAPHWSVSSTTLSSSVAAYYSQVTSGSTEAGWITLLVLNLISCMYNIFIH